MFDNRWDNWSGDFTDSFAASQLDPAIRRFVPEILTHFGAATRRLDPDWPDSVAPSTFGRVMAESMPRLAIPDAARPHVPEVIARFLEYLRESGRVGEGDEWAAQIRTLGNSNQKRARAEDAPKGVTIRKDTAAAVGRNDPCPCGSGKKYKKCCMGRL